VASTSPKPFFVTCEDLNLTVWYGITSVLFGVLLYFPLRKFMLSMAINKKQRKFKRSLTEDETGKIRKKVYIIAAGVAMTFAFVYNKVVMIRFIDGMN